MILYHGSKNRDIDKFDLLFGRSDVDFGRGIYFTSNKSQAMEWSCRGPGNVYGAVYECDVDLSQFIGVEYSSEDQDLYYLLYLCRLGLEDITPDVIDGIEKFDFIQGVMLDGKVNDFNKIAEKFGEGELSLAEFIEKTELWKDKNQVCIKSERALRNVNANIRAVHFTHKIKGSVVVEAIQMK